MNNVADLIKLIEDYYKTNSSEKAQQIISIFVESLNLPINKSFKSNSTNLKKIR